MSSFGTVAAALSIALSVFIWGCGGSSTPPAQPIIRLFYYGSETAPPSDKAALSGKQDMEPAHKIYSAVSSDGVNFTEEEGVRFEREAITDPDVFPVSTSEWIMFTSHGAEIIKATSSSVIGTYVEDISFSWDLGSVCSTVPIGDKLTTFYCGNAGIDYAFYNTSTGQLEAVGRALENPFGDGMICDPTVIQLEDGTYVMYYKYAPPGSTGPLQHSIYYATSADGLTYTDSGILIKEQASVPGAVMVDGRIYLYYVDGSVDTTAVGISQGGVAAFEFQPVTITGQTAAKAWDPNPIMY